MTLVIENAITDQDLAAETDITGTPHAGTEMSAVQTPEIATVIGNVQGLMNRRNVSGDIARGRGQIMKRIEEGEESRLKDKCLSNLATSTRVE